MQDKITQIITKICELYLRKAGRILTLTNIYFVRHAHSKYTPDQLNRSLSEKGMKDAEKITEILMRHNVKIDYVISSPYRRAIQTVEGIACQIGKKVIIEDRFKERVLASGLVEDFDSAIKKVWSDYTFSWNGGESNKTAQKRGIMALKEILKTYKNKNVAIGTHGNIMVLIMNYFDEKYDFSFWKTLQMPDIYKLSFNKEDLIEAEHIC